MGERLLIPPAVEPLTVAHAKAHMRVQHTAEDGLITAYLTGEREGFERTANRAIIAQTWQLTLECWLREIRLPRPPLQQVLSITYLDTNGATQTLAASQYVVDNSSQDVSAYITPAYGVTWPQLYYAPNAVTIQYVAGFAVPVAADSSADTLTSNGLDFENNDQIRLSTVAEDATILPAPLVANRAYYVVNASGSTFQLALTQGGSAIDITTDTNAQLFIGRIPEGIRNYLKLMVGHRYENREPVNIGNIVNPMPLAAESLFYAYRALEA